MTKRNNIEFGDFQTPTGLTRRICDFLASLGILPKSIIEPTCGQGSFLLSSLESFTHANKIIGLDINQQYIRELKKRLKSVESSGKVELLIADFFGFDWESFFVNLDAPFLFIGNPPWVTNAELSRVYSSNLPAKSNINKLSGIEAITGKSNFDISEWMLIEILKISMLLLVKSIFSTPQILRG